MIKKIDLIRTILPITLAVIVLDVIFLRDHLAALIPIGDEFSLIMESRKNPSEWFLEGFKYYFNPYPEYFSFYTNFIRPVNNFAYYIFSFFPYPHISQLVLLNYFSHGALCGILYSVCIFHQNSKTFSLLITITAFLIPAFWLTSTINYPAHGFDSLATLFCTLCIILICNKKYLPAFFFLTIALFTKETALPIAAAIAFFGILKNQRKVVLLSIIPLLIWCLFYLLAFHDSIGGIYLVDELNNSLIIKFISSFLSLPVNYATGFGLSELIFKKSINSNVLILFFNLLLWFFMFILIFKKINTNTLRPYSLKINNSDSSAILLIVLSFFASLIFFSLTGGLRFSYMVVILYLFFLSLNHTSSIYQSLSGVLLVIISIYGFTANFNSVSRVKEVDNLKYRSVQTLQDFALEINLESKIFIVNDFFSGYSNQENMSMLLTGTKSFLRANSIDLDSCKDDQISMVETVVQKNEPEIKELHISLPECANFIFQGSDPNKFDGSFSEKKLNRNQYIEYYFDELEYENKTSDLNKKIRNLGKVMRVRISNKSLIYFDFKSNQWFYLN